MFKVGDSVYSKEYGEGVVLVVYPGPIYPVVVEFDGEVLETFTTKGRRISGVYDIDKDITLLPKKENNDA